MVTAPPVEQGAALLMSANTTAKKIIMKVNINLTFFIGFS
jgi:hypothetical protein